MTHIETDLVERLMALSRNEHDDLSIGEDAANIILSLIDRLETAEARGYARGREEMRKEAIKAIDPPGIWTTADLRHAIRNLP